jgi:hypothetical protein
MLDGCPSMTGSRWLSTRSAPAGWPLPCTGHSREDEYSFILEGTGGFWEWRGDLRPDGRSGLQAPDVWHTFWNATDEPARLLEIISPAGFDQFFLRLAPLVTSGTVSPEAVAAPSDACGLPIDPVGTNRIASEYRLVTVPRG